MSGRTVIDVDIEQRVGGFHLRVRFTADGRIVGVFGRSGAGKSTLLNAVAGITRPERGHIRIDGETLYDHGTGVDLPAPDRRIGYVFQDSLLFPHLSVEANLMYGHRLRRHDERFIEPRPVIDLLGLGHLLERRPGSLSGGEKQRVGLGRALLAQPRLLLLDEPLSSLDRPRRGEIVSYVERLRDSFRVPMLYVSHSVPEIARLADTVVLLSEGECLATGPVDQVLGRMDLKPYTGRFEAGALVEATVHSHDAADQLTTLSFPGGELVVPQVEAAHGDRVRVRIRARDVTLAVDRPANISTLNVLRGRVTALREETGPIVEVQVAVGTTLLLARITQRSRRELGIRVGQDVHALIKAVTFDRRSRGDA